MQPAGYLITGYGVASHPEGWFEDRMALLE
jgi:hypothetical protein